VLCVLGKVREKENCRCQASLLCEWELPQSDIIMVRMRIAAVRRHYGVNENCRSQTLWCEWELPQSDVIMVWMRIAAVRHHYGVNELSFCHLKTKARLWEHEGQCCSEWKNFMWKSSWALCREAGEDRVRARAHLQQHICSFSQKGMKLSTRWVLWWHHTRRCKRTCCIRNGNWRSPYSSQSLRLLSTCILCHVITMTTCSQELQHHSSKFQNVFLVPCTIFHVFDFINSTLPKMT
jgi:hypothetical protein